MFKQRGASLIELAVGLTVMFFLLLAAGPGFGDVLTNWRLDSEINRLANTLELARLDAITRSQSVVACPVVPIGKTVTCAGPQRNNWSAGYFVFQDFDKNGTFNPKRDQALETESPVRRGLKLVRTTQRQGRNKIEFLPDGRLKGANAGVFALCDEETGLAARALMVNLTGQIQTMDPEKIQGFSCQTKS